MNDEPERHSRAIEVDLITDPAERTRQEARNGLRQFDEVVEQIQYSLQPERQPFSLRPSVILSLHLKPLKESAHSPEFGDPLPSRYVVAITNHQRRTWCLG